jgi:exonuclease III
MMGSENVVLWNSAGFRTGTCSTAAKFTFFDRQFPNANFAIGALVETHHKDESDFSQDLGQYKTTHNILHSPVQNETHSGVILIIRKDYAVVSQFETIPGRLLHVKLRKSGHTLNHFESLFYGPQWGKMKKQEIVEFLDKFEALHAPHERNIILGDFNFVDFDTDKGKSMDQRDKMIHPIWNSFLAKNCMVDPFRTQFPKRKVFSFVSPQGRSRGDRLYINDDRAASVKDFRYITTPFAGAHKILTFQLQGDQNIGPSTWKMNSSVLQDPRYVSEIEGVMEGLEQVLLNPLDWWDLFIMVVQGTTISYCKRKAKIKNSLRNFLTTKLDAFENLDVQTLSLDQKNTYHYYKNQLNSILEDEIRGHEIRTRGQPKYEINEPNISMYSGFEKRYQAKNVIYELEDEKQ